MISDTRLRENLTVPLKPEETGMKRERYSSCESSFPIVGLCFSCDFLVVGVCVEVGRGEPITFRAADFTAVAARNGFFFGFFAMLHSRRLLAYNRCGAFRAWKNVTSLMSVRKLS